MARCRGDTRLIAEPEETVDLYGASYGGFAETVYAEVRREAYGDEVGQASWLTRDELDRFASDLKLGSSSRLLEIASGSGGPALHLVRSTGCEVVGIDFSEDGVANANRLASEAGLEPARTSCRPTPLSLWSSRTTPSAPSCASTR